MYMEYKGTVIAYNGAVDHQFTIYRLAGCYRVSIDGMFYATAESMREAHDIIEQAVDVNGWTIRED